MRRFNPHRAAITILAVSLSICPNVVAQRGPGPDQGVLPPDIFAPPPNRPTADSRQTPPPQPASVVTAPTPQSQPQRATITYSQGLLTIAANNSSLNQILRDISRQTGMTITGGVADERVFGHYGPSAPGPVLATLLEGTSSNMLFIREQNSKPSQLILTTRNGGPTPPNPNAMREREEEERSQPVNAPTRPTPDQGVLPAQNPTPTATTPASPNTNGNTTDQQSPNGVKTPQQIMDQLMKLRQPQGAADPK